MPKRISALIYCDVLRTDFAGQNSAPFQAMSSNRDECSPDEIAGLIGERHARVVTIREIANEDGPASMDVDNEIPLRVKWSGSIYPVELPKGATVLDLKEILFELTEVLPKRQKIMGLPRSVGGVTVSDTSSLGDLRLKQDQYLMMVGSREADISAIQAYEVAAMTRKENDVVNDLDLDYFAEGSSTEIRYHESNQRKLRRRLETTEVRIINEPRPGKKLLVLDLDYTLIDTKGMQNQAMSELSRPGLHRFLACCYRKYDLVVWSQTSWRWLEAKLTELSMLMHSDYKISFVLDRTSMFSITSRRGREERRHEVKALEIIWKKFPGRWDATNTVHIDDLSRNFALNPQSGLKIAPFKNSQVSCATDRELFYLMRYLSLIACHEPDFRSVNHKYWKEYCVARAGEIIGDESDNIAADILGRGSSSAR